MEFTTTTQAQSYRDGVSGIFKITTIFLTVMIGLIVITVDVAYLTSLKSKFTPEDLQVLGSYNYTPINSSQLGNTFSPMAQLPLTINQHTQKHNFLIDSGAIASTIPQKEAAAYQLDLLSLPRIIVQGVTSTPTYGYVAEGQLNLKQEPVDLPIIFAPTDQYILGITGVFDTLTLIFDHQSQSVTFAKSK